MQLIQTHSRLKSHSHSTFYKRTLHKDLRGLDRPAGRVGSF